MITATFWDKEAREHTVSGEPGTNFGLRISAAEALRLLWQVGDDLPFHIMAAGYGDDDDWVGLSREDVIDDVNSIEERAVTLEDFESNDWGPFEISIEVPLAEGRLKYFGTDLDRLALDARAPIKQQPFMDVLASFDVDSEELVSALWRSGWAIEPQGENGGERRDPLRLYLDILHADWSDRPDYGVGVKAAWVPGLADHLGWSCVCCKEDVGWVKHERVELMPNGTLEFGFECGHCGYGEGETLDMYGNEVND